MLSTMLSAVNSLLEHACDFGKNYPALTCTRDVADNIADIGSSDDESGVVESLVSVFERRLHVLYLKDFMCAAHMLDPATFVTPNEGVSYNLPWQKITDGGITRFKDEEERMGRETALEQIADTAVPRNVFNEQNGSAEC